jgi:hypothetical protein
MNDDDIRDALARAHEPAPAFDDIALRRRRVSRAGYTLAIVSVAAAIAVYFVWPAATEEPPPVTGSIYVDMTHPALATTTIVTPLDSLLTVPGLDVLQTTPQLVSGGLP